MRKCVAAVILVGVSLASHGIRAATDFSKAPDQRRVLGRGPSSIRRRDSSFSTSGIQVNNLDINFPRRPTLEFLGHRSTEPIIFHRRPMDVPRPQLWKQATTQKNHTESGLKNVPAEWATVWYGEVNGSTTSYGSSHASFLVDARGQVYGTILDGVDSYTISSTIDQEGNMQFRYDVVSLHELPEEFPGDSNELGGDDNNGRRELQTNFLRSSSKDRGLAQFPVHRVLQSFNGLVIVDLAVIYTEQAKIAQGGTGRSTT